MLIENTLFGERNKLQEAIKRLQSFEPSEGYYVAFSGGKDSQCVYHLCKLAGVKFDAHYNVTSVDPPELIRFIRENYPDVSFDYPRYKDGTVATMWNLIPKKMFPPTQKFRYCCKILKESSGIGRVTVTGVRWAESSSRKNQQSVAVIHTDKKDTIEDAIARSGSARVNERGGLVLNDDNDENRRTVEQCYRTRKTLVNPIVDWEDEDVWEFLNDVVKVPHCELYDKGYTRLGCIGCPMSNQGMKESLEKYPKYKEAYLRAFKRMLDVVKSKGKESGWQTPEEVYQWWTNLYHKRYEIKNAHTIGE